jgi:hypothetical protein
MTAATHGRGSRIVLTGHHAITPVGLDAELTCAALRAGVARMAECDLYLPMAAGPEVEEDDALVAALVPELDTELDGIDRLLALGLGALRGLVERTGLLRADLPRTGLFVALPAPDHLLFLLGLLVVSRRPRTIAAIVTCFTAAHSATLALAALGVVTLPGRVVEPLIAATIVVVGIENLVRGDEPKGRWVLTFAFGLVHGLGFAGALKDIGLGAAGTSIVGPLIAFNLGVEVGQLAVATPLIVLLWKLRAWPPFARYGARAISLLVAAAGLLWLGQRLVR